jgi:uncharacterized membrane protein YkvA (DUF1232 family)
MRRMNAPAATPPPPASRPGLLRRSLRALLRIPFTLFYTARDARTPRGVAIAALAALVYLIVPFDLITDLLPLLGLTDDALVLGGTWFALWRRRTPETTRRANALANRLLRIREEPA